MSSLQNYQERARSCEMYVILHPCEYFHACFFLWIGTCQKIVPFKWKDHIRDRKLGCRKKFCLPCLQKIQLAFTDETLRATWQCPSCLNLCECYKCRKNPTKIMTRRASMCLQSVARPLLDFRKLPFGSRLLPDTPLGQFNPFFSDESLLRYIDLVFC